MGPRPRRRGHRLVDGALAALGGGFMFLADYPVELPWLQLCGLVPLLWGCMRAPSWRVAAGLGTVWAVAWYLPLGIMLRGFGAPLLPAAALCLYLLAAAVVFAVSTFALRGRHPLVAVVGVTAVFVGLEAIDAALPMWGTCKSLARCWSSTPEVVAGLLRVGGPLLVTGVVVGLQAVVAVALVRRRAPLLALAVPLLAAVPLANAVGGPTQSSRVRVGAVGWPTRDGAVDAERLVADAAAQGAALVVLPEGAFEVQPGERAAFAERWGAVARRHGIHLVVGFIDRERPGNRLAVFGPEGTERGEYTKTHLVPPGERYPAGDGTLLLFEVGSARVGTMICQDDNFRDMTEAYAAAGADLVVVPTSEGPPEVGPYHYRNARLRTMEYSITLVRAAARGTSAVVDGTGRVVAAAEHPNQGAAAVVADAPY